ncbi:MAG TPA: hypothetical protein VJZ00_18150 [Thermoanaerobaculia bacterium]|nr:hypothetical protein [Thermoanaerobaculia bacterium]
MSLITVGVAISWWLVERTDFFPAVGGFFGLAGIFAWIAFLADLVPKKRKEQLQDELEKRVLLRPTTVTYAVLVLIVAVMWAALHGTLVVSAPAADTKRSIEILDGKKVLDTIEVAPGAEKKVLFWTPHGTRDLIARSSGLPPFAVTLTSFSRMKIVVPQSFMTQAVLLARLKADDVAAAANGSVLVKIKRGTTDWRLYDVIAARQYNGQSIWIGAAADTELPPALRQRWASDFDRQPVSVGADQPLRAGDVIRVEVKNESGGTAATGEATVQPDKQRPFPQTLDLELADATPNS